MKSFYANNRENKPVLKNIKIQGNVNVIQIQGSKTFEYWLRISTLERGKPIYVPINIHKYGKNVLNEGQLCCGVTLSKIDGQWYATLAVLIEKKKPIADFSKMVGIDLGIKNLFTSSTDHFFGQFSNNLKTVRNEIGRATNQLVKTLETDSLVVIEKLNIKGIKFKSKHRILKASKISFALEKLK